MAERPTHHRKIVLLLLAVGLGAWGGWQYYTQLQTEPLPVRFVAEERPNGAVPVEVHQSAAPEWVQKMRSEHPAVVYFAPAACEGECLATLLKLAKLQTEWQQSLQVLVLQAEEQQPAAEWEQFVRSYSAHFTAVATNARALEAWRQSLSRATGNNSRLYVLGAESSVVGGLALEGSGAAWLGHLQRWLE